MGQKANPRGMRTPLTKKWSSQWIARTKKDTAFAIYEDVRIRKFIEKKYPSGDVADIEISKGTGRAGRVVVKLITPRPGKLKGKDGVLIKQTTEELKLHLGKKDVLIETKEEKRPNGNASLIAQSIAFQLSKRGNFRRAMKKAASDAFGLEGIHGIAIQLSGRVGGAEIARTEQLRLGAVPMQTIRQNIEYVSHAAPTQYGLIGIKVWVNHGEIVMPKKAMEAGR